MRPAVLSDEVRFVGAGAGTRWLVVAGLVLGLVGPLGAQQRAEVPTYQEDRECVALIRRLYQKSQRADTSAEWREARRCARNEDARRFAAILEIGSREIFRLGRVPMEIPEQHDEQRLMGDGGKLGPPSGIFASPYLLEFRHPWQISAHPNPGVLVAFVVVLKEPGVAAVPQTYKNLKLDFGLNCIFLRPAATPSKYEAWVLNPPGNSPCRTSGGGGGTAQGPLEVKLDTTGIDWGDNIAAARFSEDLSNNSQPLLSIPCLKDWCEIGPAGFTPHRPTAPPDPLDPDRAGHRIKGWHDEQDLEVQNPFTGDWMPSGIRGTLVPDRALASRSTGVYRDVYLPVAKIYLDRMPAMASKLFLRGLRLGWNKVELTNDVTTAAGWQFRITAETNPTGRPPEIWKLSAPPHLHADAPVPATARWRFTVLDPGIWVMCGQYCCEADGLF